MTAATTLPGPPRPWPGHRRSPLLRAVDFLVVALLLLVGAAGAWGQPAASGASATRLLRVGAAGDFRTIAEVARHARDGDTVEIDAGEYVGDVAVWTQRNLTLRGIGGLVHLRARGASAEGKAIWVIRGDNVTVQNISFHDARVPSRNGAGIRLERGALVVEDCQFLDNETGILTGNRPDIHLRVRRSIFLRNGAGDGQSHGVYAGRIGSLTVTESYFGQGRIGHLIKSRAAVSSITYNRLTDENGTSSYELEFPEGGNALVVGNVIQQGRRTDNPAIVSFGAEGYRHATNALTLSHNTLVNQLGRNGLFLFVAPGDTTVDAWNNLLVGEGNPGPIPLGGNRGNGRASADDFGNVEGHDYRLRRASSFFGRGAVTAPALRPEHEYVFPVGSVPVTLDREVTPSPGAFQTPAWRGDAEAGGESKPGDAGRGESGAGGG